MAVTRASLSKIRKRGGSVVTFDAGRIEAAIAKALQATGHHDVLETLTPRERRVIELRYGLTDGQGHTLDEVGAEIGVTGERVRQIPRSRRSRSCGNAATGVNWRTT